MVLEGFVLAPMVLEVVQSSSRLILSGVGVGRIDVGTNVVADAMQLRVSVNVIIVEVVVDV